MMLLMSLQMFMIRLSFDYNNHDGMFNHNQWYQPKQQKPDGTFNGYPIYYRRVSKSQSQSQSPLQSQSQSQSYSSIHCIGQNYRETAWIHRSCHFRQFCFDTVERDFVIFQSPQDQKLQQLLTRSQQYSSFADLSSSLIMTNKGSHIINSNSTSKTNHFYENHPLAVAIGGINTKWTWSTGVPRLRWFPRVVEGPLSEDHYQLEPQVVWIPYHSFFAQNPGHLVWDDFLPIYSLLRIFRLDPDKGNYQPLLMRYILPGGGMWATCDADTDKQRICDQMYSRFLPLFGLSMSNFSTNSNFKFHTNINSSNRHQRNINSSSSNSSSSSHPKFVCASQAVAGIGMLTDHGYKLHGWAQKDYLSMHNHGRGSILYDFRNFMLQNLGFSSIPNKRNKAPFLITFAAGSSRSSTRQYGFARQIDALRQAFGSQVEVQKVDFPNRSIQEQVQIASASSIYVTACGGGAVTAMFASEGASVILYYVENGGRENNELTGSPAMLDWDLFNNIGWLKSHWLPATTMNIRRDLNLLVQLVAHELNIVVDSKR